MRNDGSIKSITSAVENTEGSSQQQRKKGDDQRRPARKRGNDRLLSQRDIQDAALIKGIANACFFTLLHIQQIILFFRPGGLQKVLLDESVAIKALSSFVIPLGNRSLR